MLKIGIPCHYKLNSGLTACGIYSHSLIYAAYDPRDVDCLKCKKTKKYKTAMTNEPLVIKALNYK